MYFAVREEIWEGTKSVEEISNKYKSYAQYHLFLM